VNPDGETPKANDSRLIPEIAPGGPETQRTAQEVVPAYGQTDERPWPVALSGTGAAGEKPERVTPKWTTSRHRHPHIERSGDCVEHKARFENEGFAPDVEAREHSGIPQWPRYQDREGYETVDWKENKD